MAEAKPMFVSMPAAVAVAVARDKLSDINLCCWAKTYGCEPEAIKQAWEAEMMRRSQGPTNTCEIPEGK